MKPGFYTSEQLSNEEYHDSEGISCSGLKLIDRSPSHFKYGEHEETKAMVGGTAFHAACLEPEVHEKTYVRLPEEFKALNSAGVKAYKEELQDRGQILMRRDDYDNVIGMSQAVRKHPWVRERMQSGKAELSIYANDPIYRELSKCRVDFVSDSGWFIDLKKCQDVRKAEKSITDYDYHLQPPWYMDVAEWLTGQRPAGFAFVFVEEQAPYAVRVVVLHPDDFARGQKETQRLLGIYHECKEADTWPGYSDEVEWAELNAWKRSIIDQNYGEFDDE